MSMGLGLIATPKSFDIRWLNKSKRKNSLSLQNALLVNSVLEGPGISAQHRISRLSKLQLPPSEDPLVVPYESPVKPFEEVITPNKTVSELTLKIYAIKKKMENHPLFSDISSLVKRQRQTLIDNDLLIGQLQDKNKSLSESLKQAEARQEQTISSSEYEKQIKELGKKLGEEQDETKLKELESKIEQFKMKLEKAHSFRNQLEEEQKISASLRTQIAEMDEYKTGLEDQQKNQEKERNQKLMDLSHEVELDRRCNGKLTEQCDKLRLDLQTKTMSYLKEKEDLESTVLTLSNEEQFLEERIRTLNMNDNQNAEVISELIAKEVDSESLREAAISQKNAAEVQCLEFMEQNLGLTKEIEQLRATLKFKETYILRERECFNPTITWLLENKRNLEEKQFTLCERIDKLEKEFSVLRATSSVESNGPLPAQISVNPRTPNNLDPKEKKASPSMSEVRREKRNTAHDERRMQSLWTDTQDMETMTDPEVPTSLAIELMENLEAENAQLKDQMFTEQQKAKLEKRMLQRKIRRLTNALNQRVV